MISLKIRTNNLIKTNMDSIQTFLERLSQYNILNYLLPGTILCVLLESTVPINIVPNNVFEALVVFYFIGLLNSRIGSLIVEPTLKFLSIIKFAPHKDFVKAENIDNKISILSQENNAFRSYSTVLLNVLLALIYNQTLRKYPWIDEYEIWIFLILATFILIWSYGKQTRYVKNRVEVALK